MKTGSGGVCVEAWMAGRVSVLSTFGDVSVVASTGGGSVWVEAWLVWGRSCRSTGDATSVVCTESVIVLASAVATLG